ncbi:S41 family peptidase [soil metagenome]
MRHYLFTFFFVLLFLLSAYNGLGQGKKRQGFREQLNKVYSTEAIAADVEYFYTALNAAHPDLYRYISQKQLDSLLADLTAKGGHLTLQGFYNELNHIAASLGSGHLLLAYPPKLNPYFAKYAYYPPLHIELHGNIAVVKKNLVEKDSHLNAAVHAINGIPIDTLISEMNTLLMHDGYNTAANYWMLEQGWFNEIFIRYWPDTSQYTYQLEKLSDDGILVIQEVTLPAFDYEKMKPARKKRQKPEPALTFKYDDRSNTAIMALTSFDPHTISQGRQKFAKFVREAFWHISQEKPDQIIIDLRNNEGGNSFYPEMVIAYLSDKPFRLYSNMEIRFRSQNNKEKLIKVKGKKAYNRMEKRSLIGSNGNLNFRRFSDRYVANFPYPYAGTVYVMVNGGTYSAASELACYLKEHMAAVVVGTETGGSCDHITAGMYGIAKLPNTGIVVHIPLVTFHKDITQPREAGYGLKPDIQQHFRPTDSIPDPEMEHLLEIIQGKILKQ